MSDDEPAMETHHCLDGSITYPGHPVGPSDGEPIGTVDPSDYTATVLTWTNLTATPPGVRQPNALTIVEFDVDDGPIHAIGQVTDGDNVDIGDEVRPVYCEELREPDTGIRESASQEWDGYHFEPI